MNNPKKRLGEVYKDLPVGQVVTLSMNYPVTNWPAGGLTRVEKFCYEVAITSDEFVDPHDVNSIPQMVEASTTKITIKYKGIKFEDHPLIPKGQMPYWSVEIEDMDEMQYMLSK